MISLQQRGDVVMISVLGQFTLDDFRQLEEHVLYSIKFQGLANMLVDLRDMLGYSVDVAWEEIRFSRDHVTGFGRVAIVSEDQWLSWLAWLQSLFVPTNLRVFGELDEAERWVCETDSPPPLVATE